MMPGDTIEGENAAHERRDVAEADTQELEKHRIQLDLDALTAFVNLRPGQPSISSTLRVIAADVERGFVRPEIAGLPRANFLRRLARALEG